MLQQGFRRKIMRYLTLMVLAQILFIGLIFAFDVTEYARQYQKNVVEKNLSAQVDLMNDWIRIQERIMEHYSVLMSQATSGGNSTEAIADFVEVLSEQEESFTQVYYTSETGLNVISNKLVPRVDGRERQWYKGAKVRNSYVSQPYVDALTNEYVVTLSKAITDKDGKFIGVLGADIKLNDLLNRIKVVDSKFISAIVMTDMSQNVLFYESMNIDDQALFEGQSYEAINKGLSNKYNEVVLNLSGMNANMMVYLKSDQYWLDLIRYNYDFWIAILAGFVGIVIVLEYISRTLATPVKELSRNIKQISDQIGEENISQENMDEDLIEIYELFKNLDSHIRNNIRQINVMNENMKEANEILEIKNEEFKNSLSDLFTTNHYLKQSEKIYQNLIDNIDELIWVVDLQGNVIYANDKFYHWAGIDTQEKLRLNLKDFILDLKDSKRFEGLGFYGNRDFYDLDLKLDLHTALKTIDVTVDTTVIYFKGEAMSVQFIGRDVTEEKKLYQQYYHKNREMMILNDISRSLTLKEDLSSILQLITDRISNLINVSGVSVRMVDEKGELALKAVSGSALNCLYPSNPKLSGSHMGKALTEAQIVTIQSLDDLTYEDDFLRHVLEKNEAIYYFPLNNRENRFGILTVISESRLEPDKLLLLKSLSENASTAIEKATLFERLRNNYLKTIEALSNALEEKVFNYKNHTKRVAEYSRLIAERFYLSQKDLDDIYISGLLHDIGKLGIEDDILNHEDYLSQEEEVAMLLHVEIGRKIIEPIGLSSQIVDGIYLHHKNFDLSGYPLEIELDRLPLFARIIGVADAFDSYMIDSKFDSMWKIDEIYNHLMVYEGTSYCPEVLAALRELIQNSRSKMVQISQM